MEQRWHSVGRRMPSSHRHPDSPYSDRDRESAILIDTVIQRHRIPHWLVAVVITNKFYRKCISTTWREPEMLDYRIPCARGNRRPPSCPCARAGTTSCRTQWTTFWNEGDNDSYSGGNETIFLRVKVQVTDCTTTDVLLPLGRIIDFVRPSKRCNRQCRPEKPLYLSPLHWGVREARGDPTRI